MSKNISSEEHVQNNTIKLLKKMGYIFVSSEEALSLRKGKYEDVIFKDILNEQIQKINKFKYKGINYSFSPKTITRAIQELDESLEEGLLSINQKISDKLVLGTSFEEELSDANKKSFSFNYIDFENPEKNVFHFTEEYIVRRKEVLEKEKTRRPDLVLFINGIPFAVIELKKSSVKTSEGVYKCFLYWFYRYSIIKKRKKLYYSIWRFNT